MNVSMWNKFEKKNYVKMQIDFEIPEILEDQIDELLDNLNNEGGSLADCYEQEIRTTLNSCEGDLSEEQILLLRNYYCRGGIYG